ncbi:hypothetical protein ACH5RR_029923 [Cinchona calisaya]|uniref:Uncharacterized protein n=1 Tax=Cinchona calisaya TaxID=153742 RepID=A0ABD2YT58_9GENT
MNTRLVAFLTGAIPKPSNWLEEKYGAFIDLGVDDVFQEEIYLLGSIHFITEGATLDGPKSNENTVSCPSQFELVALNLGRPSDLTPFSNAEKRLPVMPTMPIFAQSTRGAPVVPSIFSISAITSEQHHKAVVGIRERIQ